MNTADRYFYRLQSDNSSSGVFAVFDGNTGMVIKHVYFRDEAQKICDRLNIKDRQQ